MNEIAFAIDVISGQRLGQEADAVLRDVGPRGPRGRGLLPHGPLRVLRQARIQVG